MMGRHALILFVALCAGLSSVIAVGCGVVHSAPQNAVWYRQFVRIRDVERRREPLERASTDPLVDATAFAGMPGPYSELASQYVEAVFSAIKAVPHRRRRYYHEARREDYERYPDNGNPIYDRDVVVPLALFPRPDSVKRWSASIEAHALGWLTEDEAANHHGSVYGRTLIFEAGTLSKNPKSLPASPFETDIPSWDLYTPDHDDRFVLDLGKLVVTPNYDGPGSSPSDRSAPLQLGEKDGGKLLGEIITIPAYIKNTRLRWVSIQNDSGARQFLAYSLLDGNGVKRASRFRKSTGGPISPYVRPLVCNRHQPKIKQHDELLLPTPLAWPPTKKEALQLDGYYRAREEWCMDDWFPAQKDACWVVREATDSKPLQESFVLMPASEESDRPVFFIALFAETEPRQLIKELATLYKVSPDVALDSPETMARLDSLYEKVRDFPLGK